MRKALIARNEILKKIPDINALPDPEPDEVVSDQLLIKRAFEPWQYPAEYREFICMPVINAKVELPVRCSSALVDAVIMDSKKGSVVVLSNYTLQPVENLLLGIKVKGKVERIESVHMGEIKFKKKARNEISFSVPLRETDFIKIYYR